MGFGLIKKSLSMESCIHPQQQTPTGVYGLILETLMSRLYTKKQIDINKNFDAKNNIRTNIFSDFSKNLFSNGYPNATYCF
jgi:hypothetical protein